MPFFSISVPTYNRHNLLQETLQSVLSQSFGDFEIIVGNDYQAEILTGETLGISDRRIRFINHPRNLREIGNMNTLLDAARGRYFTWLFDDDLYEPGFLQTARDTLVEKRFPDALFPSFRMLKVNKPFVPRVLPAGNVHEFDGASFLRWYRAEKPQVASTFGLFERETLKRTVGYMEEMSQSAIGLYSEFHYLMKCGLLERITFVDTPHYVFRRHAESYSESNIDLENHLTAGRNLIRKSAEVLLEPSLINDFTENLAKICRIHIITFAYKAARYEFARGGFSLATIQKACMRHWREYRATREIFLSQPGQDTRTTPLLFIRTALFSQYIIFRLLNYLSSIQKRSD